MPVLAEVSYKCW